MRRPPGQGKYRKARVQRFNAANEGSGKARGKTKAERRAEEKRRARKARERRGY